MASTKERTGGMSMKTFAFRSRLFLVYTAVIAVVVLLFSAVLLWTTASLNRSTELYHQQELYRKNLAEIEGILWQMDRLASQVVSNNEILGCFMPLATDGDAGNYFDKNLIDRIRISSLLSSINGMDNFASRISVFNGTGDYISTGILYETPETVQSVLEGGYYGALRDNILRRDGSFVTGFHADTWSTNPKLRLMSLYCALSSYTSTLYGVVDIQVSADALAAYSFWENGTPAYFLVNGEGDVVYPFVEMDEARPHFRALSTEMDSLREGEGMAVLERRIGREDVILMGARVFPSDWLFVRILPTSALLAPYRGNSALVLAASLVLLCCLMVVMYYLSSRIAGPLQSLSETFANVNLQNIQQSIQKTSHSYSTAELDTLSRAFHTMLIRLDQSVSMEIQAHMRALQSQMNPHFLFNMLSVIIESSEENGDKRTVAMCLKLSAMLRYVADFHGDSASLVDELQHAKNYLDLMRDRYEDLFTYEISAQGTLETVSLPKSVIQPLAENCFTHGFRSCRPPWHVRIEVEVREGRWRICVIDNGGGVTEETIRQIHDKVETYRSDVATNYQNLRLGGMGLVNTLLRLSLYQNGQVEYSIMSNPQGGTTIAIGGDCRDPGADR